jgi:hypothetical protein
MQLVVLFALLAFGREGASASSSTNCDGDSIVKKVSFENPAGMSSLQQEKLRQLLMKRCFDRANASLLGEAVYKQLREFGYKTAAVDDPIVRVLDKNLYPALALCCCDRCPRYGV